MGIFTWSWVFSIAPVAIIEKHGYKGDKPILYRRFGAFETRRLYKGLKHPIAGDVVEIPSYGACKVERILYPGGRPNKSFIVSVVISPKSIGNEEWWKQNINHPIHRNAKDWKETFVFIREEFRDLDLPEDGYIANL